MRASRSLIILLLLVSLTLATGLAAQQIVYSNGNLNGTVDAWTINFGYVVSDTFHVTSAATVEGFDIYVWEFPGDKTLTVDWSITSEEFGGTTYGSGTASVADQFISANQYGYNIDKLSLSGPRVNLSPGSYWLNLANATTWQGNPLYWDENSGPSQASESALGTIPSESFDVTGQSCIGCGCFRDQGPDCGPPNTPEPGSFNLLASGIAGLIGLAGGLRRRLF